MESAVIAQGRLGAVRRGGRAILIPRLNPRVVLVCVIVVALLAGGWLWLRDSSLVAVKRVAVTGVSGPDAARIRAALIAAARNMTTLDVKVDQLNTAVAPYPVVKSLQVDSQVPHGLRIRVIEEIPVGSVVIAGRTVAVAGDGTLLHDAGPTGALPLIPLRVSPGGPSIRDPSDRRLVAVLAAAPYQLLAHVSKVTMIGSHGLVAELRNGPAIYFGDAARLYAKWQAAAAVLADSGSVGAQYIDVTDPQRPAAGAGSDAAGSAAAAPSAGSWATSSTSSGASTAPSSAPSAASTSTPSPSGGVSGGGGG
jgi:cell division protein FtsQ